jgi:hypothetical protein
VIGGLGLTFSVASPSPTTEPQFSYDQLSAEDLGKTLFIIKGYQACHDHDAVGTGKVQLGPDLTGYQMGPAQIRLWLIDPAAVKPKTLKPNLYLSNEEIEALVIILEP